MNEQNQVSEEDILKGKKTITVENRYGSEFSIEVHALGWRDAMRAQSGEMDQSDRLIFIVEKAGRRDDKALDNLTPDAISSIIVVALALTRGVGELKKNRGATTAPAGPISSMLNAGSPNPAIETRESIPQPSC